MTGSRDDADGFRIDGLGVTPDLVREIGRRIARDVVVPPMSGEIAAAATASWVEQFSTLLAAQITPEVARVAGLEAMFDMVVHTTNSATIGLTAKAGNSIGMQSSTMLAADPTVIPADNSRSLTREDLVAAIQQLTSTLVQISLKLAPTDAARFTALVTFLMFLLAVWDHVN